MNHRQAKFIWKEVDWFRGNLFKDPPFWSKKQIAEATQIVNRKNWIEKIVRKSLILCRMAKDRPVVELLQYWDKLELEIRKHWNSKFWEEPEYTAAATNGRPDRLSRVTEEFSPRELLYLDLSYYSDRWCDWRVGYIRWQILRLKEQENQC